MYERAPCAKYENTVCGWCGSETIIRNEDFKKKCVQRAAQLNERDTKLVVSDLENESSEFDDLPKWRGQGSKKKTDPFDADLDLDSLVKLSNGDRDLPLPLEDEDSNESEEANDGFVITFDTNSDEKIHEMKDKKFVNIQKERISKILKAENKEEEEGDDIKDEEDSVITVEDVKSAEEIVDSVREFSIVQVPILKRTRQEKETQTHELIFEIKDDDETSEESSSEEEEDEEKMVKNAKIRLERTADVIRILLRVVLMVLPAALLICCFNSCRNRRRNCKCKFTHLRIVRPDPDQEEILSRAGVHARIAHQKESFGKQQEKHVYVNPLMEA
ncbi:hypothetical protein WR25_22222 isoform B [Diploscapter pachys]|uniref:Uncharacterized protein n=1 Tax=Diploscapter pachys TaxID=2018661 RepID=A0A2A2KRU6_9BILA|nr:hypothetical protein WR25_22222 isoform A [Diploscapter pachys]PAV76706.1 hypothetical protein WR25_22222 isoform B [Diploscapter pachys]